MPFCRGLYSEGNLRFQIDGASFIAGSKFTIFSLFYIVFEGNDSSTSLRGLTFGGRIHKGAYFRNELYRISWTKVNRREWLWSPANIKGANEDAKIYVARSTIVHNLLFCVHTLYMNSVTNALLLISSSVRSTQLLCFVHGQGRTKTYNKELCGVSQPINFASLLTMFGRFAL